MKNILTEKLLDMFSTRVGGPRWMDLVQFSRTEAGKDSHRASLTCYSAEDRPTFKKIMNFLKDSGYIIQKDKYHLTAFLLKDEEECINTVVEFHTVGSTNNTVTFNGSGDRDEVKRVFDWFEGEFKIEGSIIATAARLNEHKRIEFDKTFIPRGQAQLARQSFYPWLSIPLEEYYKAFMDSEQSVLVMFGPPGTAKSTFLRSLIAWGNYNAYLAYNKDVVESPQLIRQFYQSSTARILGYEDIDKHMGKRENDNTLMPSFLNAADGVVRHVGKKIVFVTNLTNIDRIDQALLREGRCFDILKFDLLTPEEAAAVRIDVGLPPVDFSSKKGWTVAEAMSQTSFAQQAINRFGRKIGFN